MNPIKRLWHDGKVTLVLMLALVAYNLVLAVVFHDLNYLVIALWIMLMLWAQSNLLYWIERATYWREAYFKAVTRNEQDDLNAEIRAQAAEAFARRRAQVEE